MHLYCFGSICRGEVTSESDVDLLAIVDGYDDRFDKDKYSIYSYERIRELFQEGNPFAWHLYKEAKLIHADDKNDFLRSISSPSRYSNREMHCLKFLNILEDAMGSISKSNNSVVLDLSTTFLAIRNFAICYSMGDISKANFSRGAALQLGKKSLPLRREEYKVFESCRILSTRGQGSTLEKSEINLAIKSLGVVHDWMNNLMSEVRYER